MDFQQQMAYIIQVIHIIKYKGCIAKTIQFFNEKETKMRYNEKVREETR